MKNKKIISLLLSLILILAPMPALAANQNKIVGLDDNVTSYIIGNEKTGDIYYEKNADESLPMASLSKLMTYLLTKEAIDEGKISPDQEVTVSKEAAKYNSWEYSALGLEEGETFTVKELLEGLIVASGNDCAYQLAVTVEDSETEFARNMTMKASELGLNSQIYYNASGVETENGQENSSSARDLFLLTKHIIEKYPEILEYGSVREITDPRRNINVESTVPLIGEIPGVDGLKTGTTDQAGACLISTADMKKIDDKDDFRTIGVVMGADQKDTRNSVMSDLIYYVSRYYNLESVLDENVAVESIKTNTVSQGYVDVFPSENVNIILKDGEKAAIKYDIKDKIKAPIKAGEVLGEAYVSYEDEEYKVPLVAKSDFKEASMFSRIMRSSEDAADFLLKVLIAR
ncbi:D-alanyl-D-alanine carboxypeptidase [Anaerococcus sp. mt242]|uniref:D-alanyl-D-alanine carboxypeptidase family protein n=1 Tax=Anaerococcus sp. mt242 TaxID=2661917 RepID=UPI0019348373|nr:D-alanyl-D-alanine carboxypeptidase family protein [Anaerococcus sp. mt242]MBM0046662.1 D-alanyl-D-alanine carboxypeptidase [Anaerococcus sp. mt242]